jgi:VIT1/CCC1 family predicted Fe2+/Mn2+ transporter
MKPAQKTIVATVLAVLSLGVIVYTTARIVASDGPCSPKEAQVRQ